MRKKLWKISVLLLVIVFAISLSACGGGGEAQEDSGMDVSNGKTPEVEEPEEETPAPEAEEFEMDAAVAEYFENMPDHIYKIGQEDFLAMVEASEDMTVLDIRSAADYEKSHVKGAVNAPWGTAISEALSQIPSDKPLFVYCYTGQTAGQAVMTLNLAGFDARSVNLGFNLGISSVDGYESLLETEVHELAGEKTEIEPDVQKALDDYYAGLADVADGIYKNYKISEADLKAKIDNGDDDFYILSIRGADAYAEGHIPGAENLPWGSDMAAGFQDLPKDQVIVVYCYTGQTAGQTVAALRLLGFDAVSLNGGMGMEANAPAGWANQGFEVVQ